MVLLSEDESAQEMMAWIPISKAPLSGEGGNVHTRIASPQVTLKNLRGESIGGGPLELRAS